MWGLDLPQDWAYIEHVEEIFRAQGAEVYYVELEADFDLRIERNKTENRLANKPLKRDLAASEAIFRKIESEHRLNSNPGNSERALPAHQQFRAFPGGSGRQDQGSVCALN